MIRKLKFALYALLLAGTAFFLGGCPYESEVPIDKPSIKVNPALIGYWTGDIYEKSQFRFKISALDEYHYDFEYPKDSAGTEMEHSIAFESRIGEERFFNLWEVSKNMDKENKEYIFYKIILSRATDENSALLNMFPVSDGYVKKKFENSAALKKYFQKHKSADFFYEKPFVLMKEK